MKNIFKAAMTCLILSLYFPYVVMASEKDQLLQELGLLRQRVEELEEKVRQLEQQPQPKEERALQQREASQLSQEVAAIREAIKGIEISFSATGVVQGSIGNHQNSLIPSEKERGDRVDGSISADLEIAKDIGGHGRATAIITAAYGDGIDPRIPSWWGINGDAEGTQRVYLRELWYEHRFFDDRLIFTLGKLDLTFYFDTNAVANCENTQFLSPGFVNSPAIDLPEGNGPGARLTYSPIAPLDISLGWGQGEKEWDELGRRSFFIAEVGWHPTFGSHAGNYRLYGWYKQHRGDEGYISWQDQIRGIVDNRDGWGLGMSLDQAITPMFTLFARVGYQDEKLYEFSWAWSVGAVVNGGYWRRMDDHLGIAYGMGVISDDYKDFRRSLGEPWYRKNESHLELYYRLAINTHLAVSPDIQVLWNAQGDARFDPVAVLGVRGTLAF